MKIAITVWGNRISPVFDAASTLLLVELGDTEPLERDLHLFLPGRKESIIALLVENNVQLLVCGAICTETVQSLEVSGIEVIPFLTGEVDLLKENYLKKGDFSSFTMPGCRLKGCCRARLRRGDGE